MPSKSERKPEEPKSTRDHLIDIGVELIHSHGYGATGLKEILDAARVPKGSFYHHFNSKEEFAAAAIERYAAREGLRCQSILGDIRLSPLKRLRRYFNELIRIAGPRGPIPGCLLGALSLEVAGQSTLLQKLLSGSFTRWQQAIASLLRLAIEQKELRRTADPDTLASFLLNSWEGALLRSIADKSDKPLNNFLHYAFDVLLTQ